MIRQSLLIQYGLDHVIHIINFEIKFDFSVRLCDSYS